MEFLRRADIQPVRLGILPGAFNPPTQAHLELARAALAEVDEAVFVLPRSFPHKTYVGANFAQRTALLLGAIAGQPCLSAAISDGGLFVDIARECRASYGPAVELLFICGRDAADRIVNWDYGDPAAIDRMLANFELLVACRGGPYHPPSHLRHRIRNLNVQNQLDGISASEVRRRIQARLPWEHLVPPAIVDAVRRIYFKAE